MEQLVSYITCEQFTFVFLSPSFSQMLIHTKHELKHNDVP
uniref:Uncharacterized protein n=1 Tax=Rhizophora mucronata TaxID=61149 RepID=A0A2P2QIW6_RHIMU